MTKEIDKDLLAGAENAIIPILDAVRKLVVSVAQFAQEVRNHAQDSRFWGIQESLQQERQLADELADKLKVLREAMNDWCVSYTPDQCPDEVLEVHRKARGK